MGKFDYVIGYFFEEYGVKATILGEEVAGIFSKKDAKDSEFLQETPTRFGVFTDAEFVFMTAKNALITIGSEINISGKKYKIAGINDYFLGEEVLYQICSLVI